MEVKIKNRKKFIESLNEPLSKLFDKKISYQMSEIKQTIFDYLERKYGASKVETYILKHTSAKTTKYVKKRGNAYRLHISLLDGDKLLYFLIKINYEHGEYCAPIRTLTYRFKSIEMIDNVKIVKVHINQEIKI